MEMAEEMWGAGVSEVPTRHEDRKGLGNRRVSYRQEY